ncbi:efflux RND transporter periplasmic adaptor subunit [Sulfurospirillum sp. 1612]|uniref:efflux RND transporter periplasmic adaptor subunit n=1 Tax=Sulfurospirillum sp. 1612 TaxID=3094835 RepID=UPI002F9486C9
MKTWVKYLIAIILIALFGILFYTKVYIPKDTFTIVSPQKGTLHVSIHGIGNVSAKEIYPITAQSGGKITAILTDEGQWVKKGDVLIVMDGEELQAQLESAQASLQKATFDIQASNSELKNTQAQKTLIQKTYDRYQTLNQQGYVTKAEYDKAQSDLQSIQAAITAARAKIKASKAEALRAQKNVEALQIKIKNLKVYAPVDGLVLSKGAQEAQDVLPTTAILTIVDPKTLWVETNIDERISAQIKPNQKASIALRSHPNHPYSGKVVRIETQSDAVTLERKIDVAFDTIPEPFYINAQALVTIHVKSYENVFKIPLNLLVNYKGTLGIWTVKDGHASFQRIHKIAQNENEIALSNIDEQTRIIVPEANKKPLQEGMKIRE